MPRHAKLRFARALLLLGPSAALLACGTARQTALGTSEGPFLSPGPLPGSARDVRSSPALPAGMAAAAPAAAVPEPKMNERGGPAGLTASGGTGLLPGAEVAGIGPVRALVVPVSLGPRLPARDDASLGRDFFGQASSGGNTLARELSLLSDGNFRPDFEVLPTLVDSRPNVLPAAPGTAELLAFARAVLQTWGARMDLTRFDNDGPDGIPSSADDDGRLDLVVLVVETEAGFPSVTLRQEIALATPKGTVRISALHILSLPHGQGSDLRPALGLALDALGLDPDERFFPSELPRVVSSLARARLGWLPLESASAAGTVRVESGRGVLIPLRDLPAGAGYWLLERSGDALFLSRIARKADGHFLATEAHCLHPGQAQTLPLTRQFGERGARVVVRWSARDAAPEAELTGVAAPVAADAGSGR